MKNLFTNGACNTHIAQEISAIIMKASSFEKHRERGKEKSSQIERVIRTCSVNQCNNNESTSAPFFNI